MRKIFIFFCGLLICSTPLYAQELSLLGGPLGDTSSSDRSYTWSLEYMQGLGEYTSISLSWLNEGHLPNNHRDGISMQFWGHTKKIDRQFVLAAGAGPYLYYDTKLAERGHRFSDTHGLGAVFSLAGSWYTESPWIVRLQANMITTNNIDTYSVMAGLGYQLNYSKGDNLSAGLPSEDKNTPRNQITLLIGQTIVNSYDSQQSLAESIEYRRSIARYLEWTFAWINEGDNRLLRRNGVLSQIWVVRAFKANHLSLGIGLGPYLSIDQHHSPRNDESSDKIAGLITLSASYRFTPEWLIRLSWNRIATTYNRDADVILIGPGYCF